MKWSSLKTNITIFWIFWLKMWKNADDLRKNKETPYNKSCLPWFNRPWIVLRCFFIFPQIIPVFPRFQLKDQYSTKRSIFRPATRVQPARSPPRTACPSHSSLSNIFCLKKIEFAEEEFILCLKKMSSSAENNLLF